MKFHCFNLYYIFIVTRFLVLRFLHYEITREEEEEEVGYGRPVTSSPVGLDGEGINSVMHKLSLGD